MLRTLYSRLAGIVTKKSQASTSWLFSPELSLPNTIPKIPFDLEVLSVNCFGVIAILDKLDELLAATALVPTTTSASLIAGSREVTTLADSRIGRPRIANALASLLISVFGFTIQRSDRSKFFIERATDPIFPAFSGSSRMTLTCTFLDTCGQL